MISHFLPQLPLGLWPDYYRYGLVTGHRPGNPPNGIVLIFSAAGHDPFRSFKAEHVECPVAGAKAVGLCQLCNKPDLPDEVEEWKDIHWHLSRARIRWSF